MQTQGVRAHVTPVVFQPEVTFTAGCRAERHAPSGGNRNVFRPQAVLLLVVNQYAADRVFIIKRVKAFHRGLLRFQRPVCWQQSAATTASLTRPSAHRASIKRRVHPRPRGNEPDAATPVTDPAVRRLPDGSNVHARPLPDRFSAAKPARHPALSGAAASRNPPQTARAAATRMTLTG